ncbi:MAG: FecR family protein [Ferruginibacter sp.]
MSRSLSGEATEEEQQRLSAILVNDRMLQRQYEMLQHWWSSRQEEQASDTERSKITRILQLAEIDKAVNIENGSTPIYPLKKKRFRWYMAAAILLLVSFTSYQWLFKSNPRAAKEILAQKGSKTRTILPDGSTVMLNAGSRIVYEQNFTDTLREVTLYGEGYFDVVKKTNCPFIVHAGNFNIRVLGTAFNVKSYAEDSNMETTLIRGLVQITRNDDTKQHPIYLHPLEKVILPVIAASAPQQSNTAKKSITGTLPFTPDNITPLDASLKETERIETAWIYNRLQFRGDDFITLARKLERWYNVVVHFEDERVKQLTFNGSLENETVEQAFEALHTATSFNYTIKQNEIFIGSSK